MKDKQARDMGWMCGKPKLALNEKLKFIWKVKLHQTLASRKQFPSTDYTLYTNNAFASSTCLYLHTIEIQRFLL